ncbi:hypothetical protein KIN20_025029 [Parelaphostrongylus tenuis]|uniref:Uncharacterized protein n=1 Tax=Parelaphostrongylus tenuis TaxID=148309 RepID=A0AAD5MUJ2_PARTN|nr:hypothetical protein KIN20_025029 [Parelaphostrongylus tenuis]
MPCSHELSCAQKYEEFCEQFLIEVQEISKYYGYELEAVDSAINSMVTDSSRTHPRHQFAEMDGYHSGLELCTRAFLSYMDLACQDADFWVETVGDMYR